MVSRLLARLLDSRCVLVCGFSQSKRRVRYFDQKEWKINARREENEEDEEGEGIMCLCE